MAEEMVEIRGDTYPVRWMLEELGGRYDRRLKCWLVPSSKKMVAENLVLNADKYRQDEQDTNMYTEPDNDTDASDALRRSFKRKE